MKFIHHFNFNLNLTSVVMVSVLGLSACTLPQAQQRPQLTPTTQNIPQQNQTQNTPTKPNSDSLYTATVIKVADGDTLTVQDAQGQTHKIRLAYIDAPETKQAHGSDSQIALSQMVMGKTVSVSVQDTDRYKRQVALIKIADQDINYRQIELGNAWHYTDYAKKSQLAAEFQRYQAALKHAQTQKLGLWRENNPQAPWAYRKQQREQNQKQNQDTTE